MSARTRSRSRIAQRGALTLLLALALGAGFAASSRAPDTAPAHGCNAPLRPVDDQDDRNWQRFLDEVDHFRQCISDYATANHAASRIHSEAANAATLEWNDFVRDSLNVPEDFPWSPP